MPDLGDTNLDDVEPAALLEYDRHLETLRRYAVTRHEAMHMRSLGNIAMALTHEARCEKLYGILPHNWRW